MFLTVCGTEWLILCWCAVRELVTHAHVSLCVCCSGGPVYSSSERVLELVGTEDQRLTITCTANGSAPISYEFFKVCTRCASACACLPRDNSLRTDAIVWKVNKTKKGRNTFWKHQPPPICQFLRYSGPKYMFMQTFIIVLTEKKLSWKTILSSLPGIVKIISSSPHVYQFFT